MEGWVFFLILIIGAFLFSFFGVVVLLTRTHRQGEKIRELGAEVRRLRERYAKEGEVSPDGVSPDTPPLNKIIPDNIPALSAGEPNPGAALNAANKLPPDISEMSPGDNGISSAREPAHQKQGRLKKTVLSFIRSGNLWAAGGVLLLAAGFGALIAYLGRRGFFTVEMGIGTAAAAGVGMILLGWRFRQKQSGYFLSLQGGGLGILYLAVFAAHKLTPYFGTSLSLLLVSLLIPPALILALFQNSRMLALLGFAGGFAAPLLLSGGENHLFMFSYYLVLNCGVFAAGFFRDWKSLNLLAFFITFISSLLWTMTRYKPDFFYSSEPFFAAFFILFTLMGLRGLGSAEKAGRQKGGAVLVLILGTPAAAAVLQWKVFSFVPHGHAVVAIIFSAFYLFLTVLILKKFPGRRIYAEAYLALGTVLANIVIPLELNPGLGGAIWAVEGAFIFFFGLRASPKNWRGETKADNSRPGDPRIIAAGIAVHIIAAAVFIYDFSSARYAMNPLSWRSPAFSGSLIIALTALAMAAMAEKLLSQNEKEKIKKMNPLPLCAALWGFAWWFGGWYFEFRRILPGPGDAFLAFASLTAILSRLIAALAGLRFLRAGMVPAPLVAALTVLGIFGERIGNYLFRKPEVIFTFNFFDASRRRGWLAFLAVQGLTGLLLLAENKTDRFPARKNNPGPSRFRGAGIFTVTLTTLAVLSGSARFFTTGYGLSISWTSFAGMLPFLAALAVLPCFRKPADGTLARNGNEKTEKLLFSVLPWILSGILILWFIVTLFMSGDPSPLRFYVPLLSPLDLLEGLCIASVIFWRIRQDKILANKNSVAEKTELINVVQQRAGKPVAALSNKSIILADILIFFWIASILARSVHYYGGIPWRRVPGSDAFQFCLFVFWALYGILHIILGHRKKRRLPWIAGAVLVASDIAKLILLDMRDIGAVPKILSLFAAGLILLFIGRAAPLPPSPDKTGGATRDGL